MNQYNFTYYVILFNGHVVALDLVEVIAAERLFSSLL